MYSRKYFLSYLLACILLVGFVFTSCNNDDDVGTSEIQLLSFGPTPALRGAEIRIIGTNLDQVTSVELTDNVNVSSFNSQSSELITLSIPEETVNGPIILKTPTGDIESKSILSIAEPIIISSFSPETIRPDNTLTINGDYLNLIKAVVFNSNVSIGDSMFISQSRERIELVVPAQAQTGFFFLTDEIGEFPIEIESETELNVVAPSATSIASNPIRAGDVLTINGSNLDLAIRIGFQGAAPVTDFISQTENQIEVIVPDNAQDGDVLLIPGSFIEIPANEPLVMVVPTIASLTPNPAKNANDIVITGSNLDLTKKVIFGGGKQGFILSKTESEMTVKVPPNASEDVVVLETGALKTVGTLNVLELIRPNVTSFTPNLPSSGEELTILGEDMDLANSVIFTGGSTANVNNAFEDMATVTIPDGAKSGPITIVMLNEIQVVSSVDLVLAPVTNAVITNIPSTASIGEMISIVGTDLNELNEVIFPGDITATMFGLKTDLLIEVFVPQGTQTGLGTIKFITFDGEEFFSPEIDFQ